MKQSDLNHLRRLLGWIRCDIGQAPGEMVQTMIDVAGKLGNPEISPEAQGRLMESYRRAEAVPIYVRDAVKALEKVVAATGRQGRRRPALGADLVLKRLAPRRKPAPMLGLTLVLPLGASRRWTTSRLRMAWQRLGFTPGARGQRTGLPEPNMPLAFCVATSNPWQRSTARTRLARQRRRSRTTPTRRPTRRRAATPRRLPTLRRDTGSVRCECSLTIRLAGDGCRHCQPQTYIDSLEMCAEDNLRTIEQLQSERAEQARLLDAGGERELALMARIDALEAARFAYASEFPSNEDGDPDVGSIHQNIRALKDRLAQVDRKTAGQPKSCRSTEQLQVIQEALRLLPSDEARRVAREAEAGSGAVTPAQYVGAGAVAVLANAWLEKAANLCFDPQDAERIRALKDQAEKGDEELPTCETSKFSAAAGSEAQGIRSPFNACMFRAACRAMLDHQQSATTEAAMDACGAEITSYALLGGTRVERVAQPDGTYLWAVRRNGRCLGLDGHWSYEPLPSSRTDEWLARHRFPTVQAAIDASRRQEGEAC